MAKKSNSVASCSGEHMSVSVRKIANGYVVSHSTDGPGGYKHTETYHEKKPALNVAAVKKAAAGGAKKR